MKGKKTEGIGKKTKGRGKKTFDEVRKRRKNLGLIIDYYAKNETNTLAKS